MPNYSVILSDTYTVQKYIEAESEAAVQALVDHGEIEFDAVTDGEYSHSDLTYIELADEEYENLTEAL